MQFVALIAGVWYLTVFGIPDLGTSVKNQSEQTIYTSSFLTLLITLRAVYFLISPLIYIMSVDSIVISSLFNSSCSEEVSPGVLNSKKETYRDRGYSDNWHQRKHKRHTGLLW
jgi:hypothetical protein